MLTKQQMLDAVDGLVQECGTLHTLFQKDLEVWTADFAAWLKACHSTIETIFSANSDSFLSFTAISFSPSLTDTFKSQQEKDQLELFWFDSGLRYAHSTLRGFRYTIEYLAEEKPASRFIFISHGGPTRVHVDATKDFITALGLSPVVVADLPNLNMSINDKVVSCITMCSGAIVLATVEDETMGHEKRARPNVENEVGALQATPSIGGRIIYLKEPEVQLASNYREKVWTSFKKEYVESTFVHIIQELRAFGLLS